MPIHPTDRPGTVALARSLGRAIPQADGADRMYDDDVAALVLVAAPNLAALQKYLDHIRAGLVRPPRYLAP